MKENRECFNLTAEEKITAEMNQLYNERFEELYNEDKNNVNNYIRTYRNNGMEDDDLRQIVYDAMFEAAKKETTFDRETKKDIPMRNRLHYFRFIVHKRLKDKFRYDNKTKGRNDNGLIGKIRKYKSSKEEKNETYEEEDILDIFDITKERYDDLMAKVNRNTALSLDSNNGTSDEEIVNFYSNHGEDEKGYEVINEGWKNQEEKRQNEDDNPYSDLQEAYRIVFPKNKGQTNFHTMIQIMVEGKDGKDIAKEEGLTPQAISERLGKTMKNGPQILSALEDIKRRKEELELKK